MPNFIPSGVSPEQFAKVHEDKQSRLESRAYEGPVYRTDLVNKRDCDAVLREDGKAFIRLKPKVESFVESWSPHTNYAPYKTVTFEKDGTISLGRRHNFPDLLKDAEFVLELINVDGSDSETIRVNDQFVTVERDLPKRISVRIDDPLVVYKRIQWKRRTVKVPCASHKNYLETRTVLEKQMIQRKASEIRKIKKHFADEALEEVRKSNERRFPGVVGGPETDEVDHVAEVQGPDVEG